MWREKSPFFFYNYSFPNVIDDVSIYVNNFNIWELHPDTGVVSILFFVLKTYFVIK